MSAPSRCPAQSASSGDTSLVYDTKVSSWRIGFDLQGGVFSRASGTLVGQLLPYEIENGRALGFGGHFAWEPVRVGVVATLEFADLELPEPFLDLDYTGYSYGLWVGWELYGLGVWDPLVVSPIAGVNIGRVSLSQPGLEGSDLAESGRSVEYISGLSVGVFGKPLISRTQKLFISLTLNYLYRFATYEDFSAIDPSLPPSDPFADPSDVSIDNSSHALYIAFSVAGYRTSMFGH